VSVDVGCRFWALRPFGRLCFMAQPYGWNSECNSRRLAPAGPHCSARSGSFIKLNFSANLLHADYLTRRSFHSAGTGIETKGSLGRRDQGH
jgi:hypothetical protein